MLQLRVKIRLVSCDSGHRVPPPQLPPFCLPSASKKSTRMYDDPTQLPDHRRCQSRNDLSVSLSKAASSSLHVSGKGAQFFCFRRGGLPRKKRKLKSISFTVNVFFLHNKPNSFLILQQPAVKIFCRKQKQELKALVPITN